MRWLFLALVPVLALVVGCSSGADQPENREPEAPKGPATYEGRTSKQWLEQFRKPDPDPTVHATAAEALGTIGDDDAADGLIAALNGDDFDRSLLAARYLGWMKAKADKILPPLKERTKHHTYQNSEQYRETVDNAIRKLSEAKEN
jgi:hypothetical protein